ncbi:MAG: Gfo/Idh/MocA family oxidoreductase [Clostridia bacterium]|nr:Gfo/Idh/MocA family oxidoreductase [Clostridia bacterium]
MIKVGLIGCGFMGTMHSNCYKNIDGVEVVAYADIRHECAQKLAQGTDAKIYSDGYDLINGADVDVIDICLPTYLHCEYAVAAMDKVKYVFVEKPVALTEEQGEQMINKAVETGAVVQVGQVIRFWDEYVKLAEIIKGGELGKIINANFRRISPRPDWGWNDWLLKNELSGGAAQDLHIHDMDYVLSLFSKPNGIKSVKNTAGEQASYINSLLTYDDFVVSVEGTWDLPGTHPFEATFRVVFEKGVVENAGGKFMLYTDKSAQEIVIEKKEDLGTGFEGGNISDLGGYYNELVYFTDCAKAGKAVEKATLQDGVESLCFVLEEIRNA